jgi:phthiocerol/phenolphthiocerol synthesis type-I polyketide synthase E
LGEVTAACVAGVFSLEDAVRLVAVRGRLMHALPEGALLAVTMAPAELKRRLNAELSLAIVNGPTACVVAGAPGPVAVLEDALRSEGVPARRLPATHAFQSHLMEPVVAPLLAELRTMTLRAPEIPFLSNGTGRWITAAEATSPEYWAQQCRRTVYFGDGLRELAKEPNRLFVEVGPGRILAGLLRPNLDAGDARVALTSLPDARERKPEVATLLGTVGRLWTAGVALDWRVVGGGGRRKTLLPTYPFERQRFWIDPVPPKRAADDEVGREAIENWFYATVWRQSATPWSMTGEGLAHGTAWIVTTAEASGRSLAEALRSNGVAVIERPPGAEWGGLLASARADGRRLKGIYAGDFLSATTAAEAENVFMELLALAPALVSTGEMEPLRFLLATERVHRVRGDEELTTAGALAAGLAQVLPRELPFVDARQVDLAGRDDGGAVLLAEAMMADGERLSAWRGGMRWVPQFERLALADTGDGRWLRERGVYVITGGFGGIGLVAAEMLARRVKARLVLVGRRGGTGREAEIARLEALGAEVLAVSADVGMADGVGAMLAAAEAKWGAVHGVIHTAGVPGKTIAARKTRAEATAVFAPKLRGAAEIAAAVGEGGRKVDFVLYCSSLAVWAGSAGQSDYVAANAFLDAQARVLAARGVRAVSANWDLWSGIGMGRQDSKTTQLAITPVEGASALVRVLGSPWPAVAVSTAALPRRFARQVAPPVDAPTAVRYPRPSLATEFTAPAAGSEQVLAAQWQTILGIDRVGANDNFFELGGDSLTAMQAIARIKAEWSLALPVTTFYDAPTVRALGPVVAALKAASAR